MLFWWAMLYIMKQIELNILQCREDKTMLKNISQSSCPKGKGADNVLFFFVIEICSKEKQEDKLAMPPEGKEKNWDIAMRWHKVSGGLSVLSLYIVCMKWQTLHSPTVSATQMLFYLPLSESLLARFAD